MKDLMNVKPLLGTTCCGAWKICGCAYVLGYCQIGLIKPLVILFVSFTNHLTNIHAKVYTLSISPAQSVQ